MISIIKQEAHHGWYQSGSEISIRREYIVEDAFDAIFIGKINLHTNFRIKFVDQYGVQEDGIDGGGLLKEFMTKITEKIFDP